MLYVGWDWTGWMVIIGHRSSRKYIEVYRKSTLKLENREASIPQITHQRHHRNHDHHVKPLSNSPLFTLFRAEQNAAQNEA